jgi:hypothetical protein
MIAPAGSDIGVDWQPLAAPWDGPRRLWSLWEMITLRPIELMNIVQSSIALELALRDKSGPLSESELKSVESFKILEEIAESLELPITLATIRNMLLKADTKQKLRIAILQTCNTIFMEVDQRKYFGPLERFTKYFEQPKLFGDEVFNAFSSANDDIYEAGTCLALERSTACVMHLNRALECGLAALAKVVDVSKQNDWGGYTREIGKKLDARAKAAGARSSDEQFYAEAAENFDRLRRAYRNPTMHPERTYTQDRAEEILLSTKSFMTHLASRISE